MHAARSLVEAEAEAQKPQKRSIAQYVGPFCEREGQLVGSRFASLLTSRGWAAIIDAETVQARRSLSPLRLPAGSRGAMARRDDGWATEQY